MTSWRSALGLLLLATNSGRPATPPSQPACSLCAEWNQPQQPFQIYGNTYFVGPHGLSSILITSPAGHILIDGAIAESAPQIAAHIRQLGFRLEDVKLILNTHAHHDHAGGIPALQRLTGATVFASPWSAKALEAGGVANGDPQLADVRRIAPVRNVHILEPNQTLRLGPIAITAHFTPGHTPGGTSWTWTSCQSGRCLNLVYADSLSPIASDGWSFRQHPAVVASFQTSYTFLDTTPCDILITPHPSASTFEQRMTGKLTGPGDGNDCRRLAQSSREALQKRLATEARASHLNAH